MLDSRAAYPDANGSSLRSKLSRELWGHFLPLPVQEPTGSLPAGYSWPFKFSEAPAPPFTVSLVLNLFQYTTKGARLTLRLFSGNIIPKNRVPNFNDDLFYVKRVFMVTCLYEGVKRKRGALV